MVVIVVFSIMPSAGTLMEGDNDADIAVGGVAGCVLGFDSDGVGPSGTSPRAFCAHKKLVVIFDDPVRGGVARARGVFGFIAGNVMDAPGDWAANVINQDGQEDWNELVIGRPEHVGRGDDPVNYRRCRVLDDDRAGAQDEVGAVMANGDADIVGAEAELVGHGKNVDGVEGGTGGG